MTAIGVPTPAASAGAVEFCTIGETMGLIGATEVGPLRNGALMRLGLGGAESNVAIGIRRLGHSAAWISRVGDDPLGALIVRELRAEQVNVDYVRVDPGAPTGLMMKIQRTAAASEVHYLRKGSAAAHLAPADVPAEVVSQSRILHVTGITPALSSSAHAAIRTAVDIARNAGVTVSFDVNLRTRLWRDADPRPVLRELTALADVVFASEHEAELLVTATDPVEAVRALSDLGPRTAVLKRGAQGYVASVDGEIFHDTAIPVPIADTVGAGDAFVAGFLAGVLDDMPASEALSLANYCGALVVAAVGDWEGLPTHAEIAEFRARRDAVSR